MVCHQSCGLWRLPRQWLTIWVANELQQAIIDLSARRLEGGKRARQNALEGLDSHAILHLFPHAQELWAL